MERGSLSASKATSNGPCGSAKPIVSEAIPAAARARPWGASLGLGTECSKGTLCTSLILSRDLLSSSCQLVTECWRLSYQSAIARDHPFGQQFLVHKLARCSPLRRCRFGQTLAGTRFAFGDIVLQDQMQSLSSHTNGHRIFATGTHRVCQPAGHAGPEGSH